jgi:DNA-binding CsgD family transcriptional regulator
MNRDHDGISISAREHQIIELASRGYTDKEICRALSLSLTTVRTYWGRAREKLGAVNRAQVVAQVTARNAARRESKGRETDSREDWRVGSWVCWADGDRVDLDAKAAEMFGFENCRNITLRDLLEHVAISDRNQLETVLKSPKVSMTMPAVWHRSQKGNGSAAWVRTIVMGPCEDPQSGVGWVFASMQVEASAAWVKPGYAVI